MAGPSLRRAGTIAFNGKWFARGKTGNGGTLTVSEPDPTPDGGIGFSKAKLDFRGALAGGLVHLDADAIAFVPYFPSQIIVRGATSPGEIRINHTGTTPCEIAGDPRRARVGRRRSARPERGPHRERQVPRRSRRVRSACRREAVVDTSALASDLPLAPSCPQRCPALGLRPARAVPVEVRPVDGHFNLERSRWKYVATIAAIRDQRPIHCCLEGLLPCALEGFDRSLGIPHAKTLANDQREVWWRTSRARRRGIVAGAMHTIDGGFEGLSRSAGGPDGPSCGKRRKRERPTSGTMSTGPSENAAEVSYLLIGR